MTTTDYRSNPHSAHKPCAADRAAGGLVTDANKGARSSQAGVLPGQQAAREKRDGRYKALKFLWELSSLDRVRTCRRHSVRPAGTVDVRHNHASGLAGFSGVATCGSVWACPVCSARIQSGRREELKRLVDWADDQGKVVLFGTMTLRHNIRQSLDTVWSALGGCFKSVRTNGSVRNMRAELGFSGYVRTVEVTHSPKNGWHPHIHMLYVLDREVTDTEIQALGDTEFSAWAYAAHKAGLGAPLRERYQLERVTGDVEDYLAKAEYDPKKPGGTALEGYRHANSAAYELAGSATKVARQKSRTPFQILADVQDTYNADDCDLWLEYERVSKGKKALTWSNGLKKEINLIEQTDEELAEEAVGDVEDTIFAIAKWSRDISPNPVLASQLLTSVELGGRSAGLAFCQEHGIETLSPTHVDVLSDQRQVRMRANESRENAAMTTAAWGSSDRARELDELSERLAAAYESPDLAQQVGLGFPGARLDAELRRKELGRLVMVDRGEDPDTPVWFAPDLSDPYDVPPAPAAPVFEEV